MSKKFPVIAITGSSGAGTSSVMESFEYIFRRENIRAQIIEGDSMHRYERVEMDALLEKHHKTPGNYFSHFSPEANELAALETTFNSFGQTGQCKIRKYIHSDAEGVPYKQTAGTLTPWRDCLEEADVLFYEGLHGGYVGNEANVAKHVDLLVGVVPIINL